jgi:hypothetical protein
MTGPPGYLLGWNVYILPIFEAVFDAILHEAVGHPSGIKWTLFPAARQTVRKPVDITHLKHLTICEVELVEDTLK